MQADPAVPAPLLVRQEQGVLWLTLNRPHARNAVNAEVRVLLRETLSAAAAAPDVRAVVIQGDERAFSAGADVNEMDGEPGTIARMLDEGHVIVESIARLPKPVIAAVRGPAAGSGFSIAMACDIVVADETAVFHSSFAKLALIPDWAATYWLARQVGLYRAKEILFSARPVPAAEAQELGLVSRLWPAAEFDAELRRLAHELASGPTVAFGVTKRLLNRTFETDLSTALELENLGQLVAVSSQDHLRSVEAFRNRTSADAGTPTRRRRPPSPAPARAIGPLPRP
jgi:2-(1,2-epoxy-1,2-dihydrophenyl)acetyl-CoA isomerase